LSLGAILQTGGLFKRTLLHVLLGTLVAVALTAVLALATLGIAGLFGERDPSAKADSGEGAPAPKPARGVKGAGAREKRTPERSSGKDD
jgi:hypothetical protein